MRIIHVTEFYSAGMGYTENILPRTLARLGHEVHVVASTLQVYGNLPNYESTYGRFLGPAEVSVGTSDAEGFKVHRLPYTLIGGYVAIRGLLHRVGQLRPDIVQANSPASLATFALAGARRVLGYRLFTECHQHLSVVHGYLKGGARPTPGSHVRRIAYLLSRTVPGYIASLESQKCYAVAPDCADIAHRLYGVPRGKIELLPLGTDTDMFRPSADAADMDERVQTRLRLGFAPEEVVCIYTGRFSEEKNPLLLAQAVRDLRRSGRPFRGLFVGDGTQRAQIEEQAGCCVVPFVPARTLPALYRCSDIAVWPTQESMSMLDAAASGLPLIVSDRVGDSDRVEGNGHTFREGDAGDLAATLGGLEDGALRQMLGSAGRRKVLESYSWRLNAEKRIRDYGLSLERQGGTFQ